VPSPVPSISTDTLTTDAGSPLTLGGGASMTLNDFVKSFQPFTGKSVDNDAAYNLRKDCFAAIDTRGTGRWTLTDVESFALYKLEQDHGSAHGKRIFDSFRSSCIFAYVDTKAVKKLSTGDDDDYIGFAHFRVLNVYFCFYAGVFDAFSKITGKDILNGTETMSKEQWMNTYHPMRFSGLAALGRVTSTGIAHSAFSGMTTDSQDSVKFSAFCNWVKNGEMDSNKDLGPFRSFVIEQGAGDTRAPSRYEKLHQLGTKSLLKSLKKKGHRPSVILERPSVILERPSVVEATESVTSTASTTATLNRIRKANNRNKAKLLSIRQNSRSNRLSASNVTSADSVRQEQIIEEHKAAPRRGNTLSAHLQHESQENERPSTRRESLRMLTTMKENFTIPIPNATTNKAPEESTDHAIKGISVKARLALHDFSEHLGILEVEFLDEQTFGTLLDDMGYTRDRAGLFDRLLREVADVNPSVLGTRNITVNDMFALYKSEPYHLLDNGKDNGDALMDYVDKLFDTVDVNGSGGIDRIESITMVQKLLGRTPSHVELDALFDVLDMERSGIIDRMEFKQWVIKPNIRDDTGIPSKCSISIPAALITLNSHHDF